MFYLLLLPPLLIIGGVVVYLLQLPAQFQVRRSRVLAVAPQAVFDAVRDLRSWPHWSPWLLHEPDAKLTYSATPDQEGGSYGWDGRLIGAGTLTQVRLQAPDRIEQRIAFRRPFKSQAEVWWQFDPNPEGCEVTWGMRGRLPFALRFLAPTMTRSVAKDYELGLAMLDGHLDPDAAHPRLRFVGVVEQPPRRALTLFFSGTLHELLAAMVTGFPRLAAALAARGIQPAGPPFTAYHQGGAKARGFVCDLALPIPDGADAAGLVDGLADGLAADGLDVKQLGGGRCLLTEVQGSYEFLDPAWSAVMAHLRMARLRQDTNRPSLEVYVQGPDTVTHSNAILTQILVPVR